MKSLKRRSRLIVRAVDYKQFVHSFQSKLIDVLHYKQPNNIKHYIQTSIDVIYFIKYKIESTRFFIEKQSFSPSNSCYENTNKHDFYLSYFNWSFHMDCLCIKYQITTWIRLILKMINLWSKKNDSICHFAYKKS